MDVFFSSLTPSGCLCGTLFHDLQTSVSGDGLSRTTFEIKSYLTLLWPGSAHGDGIANMKNSKKGISQSETRRGLSSTERHSAVNPWLIGGSLCRLSVVRHQTDHN